MADSIILATAKAFNATLWTQDSDFENIPGVKYFPKKELSMTSDAGIVKDQITEG
jgi:hypothetical protein